MATPSVFLLPGLVENADVLGVQVEKLRGIASRGVADLTGEDSIAGRPLEWPGR